MRQCSIVPRPPPRDWLELDSCGARLRGADVLLRTASACLDAAHAVHLSDIGMLRRCLPLPRSIASPFPIGSAFALGSPVVRPEVSKRHDGRRKGIRLAVRAISTRWTASFSPRQRNVETSAANRCTVKRGSAREGDRERKSKTRRRPWHRPKNRRSGPEKSLPCLGDMERVRSRQSRARYITARTARGHDGMQASCAASSGSRSSSRRLARLLGSPSSCHEFLRCLLGAGFRCLLGGGFFGPLPSCAGF